MLPFQINELLNTIEPIPFLEHPVKNYEKEKYDLYDIHSKEVHSTCPDFIIDEEFSLKLYCECLIFYLIFLPEFRLKEFLVYQLSQVNYPVSWLNNIIELLEKNELILSLRHQNTLAIVLREINLLKQEYQNDIKVKRDKPKLKAKALDVYQTAILFYHLKELDAVVLKDKAPLAHVVSHLTGHPEKKLAEDKGFGKIEDIMTDPRHGQDNYNTEVVLTFLDELKERITEHLNQINGV